MNQGNYELNLMVDPRLPFRMGQHADITGDSGPINWHENIEILYCASGEGFVRKNGACFPFKEGDIVVVNSEEVHSLHHSPAGTYRCIIIDRHFCAECGIPSTSLVFQSHIRDPQMKEAFLQIIDAHNRYIRSGEFYEAVGIRSLTLDFLYRLCRDYLVSEQSEGAIKRNDALKTAITYIREHLSEPITMDTLTQLTGLSENTLLRRFKRAFGRSVIDTILLLRCTEAKRLIENGSSVTDAAHACGFENMSYFTRTFKRYYQIPPSCYLQKRQAPSAEA